MPRRCACPPARATGRTSVGCASNTNGRSTISPAHVRRSLCGDLVERAAEMDRAGTSASVRPPRNRRVQCPVDLEHAHAVAIATEPAAIARRQSVAGNRQALVAASRRTEWRARAAIRPATFTRRPVSIVPPACRKMLREASAMRCEPPRGMGQPTACPAMPSMIATAALGVSPTVAASGPRARRSDAFARLPCKDASWPGRLRNASRAIQIEPRGSDGEASGMDRPDRERERRRRRPSGDISLR